MTKTMLEGDGVEMEKGQDGTKDKTGRERRRDRSTRRMRREGRGQDEERTRAEIMLGIMQRRYNKKDGIGIQKGKEH